MRKMKDKFRIIFMGTPEFAVPSLEALLSGPDQVVAVVTQPDRPKGRGKKLTPPPVKQLALANDVPVLQPTKIRGEDFLATLRGFQPDLIVVTAYGRILPGHLLNMPPLGTINVHGSLLPGYRGAAPVQWALINNDIETGVTIMQMDEGMDTGDILLPAAIPIEPDDTAGSLAVKLAELGGRTLAAALDLLRRGELSPQKQDDSLATLAPPLAKEDGLVDWSRPALAISGLIRGLDPWPTTYTFLQGTRIRLFCPQVVATAEKNLPPGTVCRADSQGIVVATGRDLLRIKEVQPEGKRRMSVEAFLCGSPLTVGTILGR